MTLRQVREFQEAFEIPIPTEPTLPGRTKLVQAELQDTANQVYALSRHMVRVCADEDNSTLAMRAHLMLEELAEVLEAMAGGDIVKVLHELCDLRVVADGTVCTLGLESRFQAAFDLVHAANMSKLEDGKPVKTPAGRVVKGKFFQRADLTVLFEDKKENTK